MFWREQPPFDQLTSAHVLWPGLTHSWGQNGWGSVELTVKSCEIAENEFNFLDIFIVTYLEMPHQKIDCM